MVVVSGVLAASSARLVYSFAALLVVLGLAMLVLTVWLIRSTRPDPEVLVRLEVMSTRRWRAASTLAREQQLATARPGIDDGMAAAEEESRDDSVDEAPGGEGAEVSVDDPLAEEADEGTDREEAVADATDGADEASEGGVVDEATGSGVTSAPTDLQEPGELDDPDDTPTTATRSSGADAWL